MHAAGAPLVYELPGTWTRLSESPTATKRAVYKIPRVANETDDGELTVLFFGTGSQGDPERHFKEWLEAFDFNPSGAPVKKAFDSPAGAVESVEHDGTYKISLGPAVGPKKKSPMQMVKDKYRLYGAVVRTKDRGNWFFKLVGPNETVLASKDALEAALKSAK